MIIESILNLLAAVIKTVFSVLPSIPNLDILDSVLLVFDTIFSNLQLLGCFIRPTTIVTIVPVFLIIYNFDYVYKITMFILDKIPGLNID